MSIQTINQFSLIHNLLQTFLSFRGKIWVHSIPFVVMNVRSRLPSGFTRAKCTGADQKFRDGWMAAVAVALGADAATTWQCRDIISCGRYQLGERRQAWPENNAGGRA